MAETDNINSLALDDDLRITIYPDGTVRFTGSSTLLIAEGLIPKNLKWPDRDITSNWNDEQFHYGVNRVKPEGMKAPKAEWVKLDNWELTRTPHNQLRWDELAIREKLAELEQLEFSISKEGKEQFNKCYVAFRDEAFQRFKQIIPGLAKKKRGRKA